MKQPVAHAVTGAPVLVDSCDMQQIMQRGYTTGWASQQGNEHVHNGFPDHSPTI